MNARSVRLSLIFASLLVLPSLSAFADDVDLSTGGHLYGAYSLNPNATLSEQFTLNQATEVTGFSVAISAVDPLVGVLNGSYTVTLSGPGGVYAQNATSADGTIISGGWSQLPLGDVLPEGTYTLLFKGGACGSGFPCAEVGAIDFYAPATYTQIGGSIANAAPGGGFGFDLLGTAVTPAPEPAAWLLLATGMLSLPLQRRLRRTA